MHKNSFKNAAFVVSTLLLGILISSCSKPFSTPPAVIESEMESIVCPQNYEVTLDFFNQLMTKDSTNKSVLNEEAFNQAMAVDDLFKGVAGSYLKTNLYKLYLEFTQDISYLSSYESNENIPELVTVLKIEDTENHLRKELVEKYKNRIALISKDIQSMGYSCADKRDETREETREPASEDVTKNQKTAREQVTDDLIHSMRKVMAVTYQSCAVLDRNALDKEDADVKGITEKCCYPRTTARMRYISSLADVISTHHYIQKSYSSQCHDLKKKPLIYDFGGRPSFTFGSKGQLNFFKNNGGTEVLGYDCSAMVYTVLLGGGFRLIENKVFSASDVSAAQSRQFLDTRSKGWSCLNAVEFQDQTLEGMLEGDIATQDGHTVMIYRAGKDPYGIDSLSDCKKIDFTKFDFDIMQSSPSKDGVGVNVHNGSDYLLTNSTMRKGFIEYAQNYCERTKEGSKKILKLNYFSLVRASSSTACRMQNIKFENESCVQECI